MTSFCCSSCLKSNISTKDLPCPRCGGDDLFEENLNLEQTEPQKINFGHKTTEATEGANVQLMGSSSSLHGEGNNSQPDLLDKIKNSGSPNACYEYFKSVNEAPQQDDNSSKQQTRLEGKEIDCALDVQRMPASTLKSLFRCVRCGKVFRLESVRNVHAQYKCKPHKCKICPKKFRWENQLKKHQLKHSEEIPFEKISK